MRRKIVHVQVAVGSDFYKILDAQRKRLQEKMGFRKTITNVAYTEMLARSGKLKLPELNVDLFKDVRKKKFIKK